MALGAKATLLEELFVELIPVQGISAANGKPLGLERFGRDRDGGYIVEEASMKDAEALFGYGINTDSSFEDLFAKTYKVPVHAFDGGVDGSGFVGPGVTFHQECIGTADTLYEKKDAASYVVTDFGLHLTRAGIEGKPVAIKMDIEGAEFDAFDCILPHIDNVSTVLMELHFSKDLEIPKALRLLRKLKETHVLLHSHPNNNCKRFTLPDFFGGGRISRVVEITLVHKKFVIRTTPLADLSFPKAFDQPNVIREGQARIGL